jgi:cytochrome c-type biogenesis protein CcmH
MNTPADPVLEARVQAVAAELRCLVCQNQTVADSQSALALDVKRQVREMFQQGQSREQVLAYMTARYGDFVLVKPPLQPRTAVLWWGPGVLLAGGLAGLVVVLRRRARLPAERFEADDEERA